MTRKEELQEFARLLNTLCTKYEVSLNITINDRKATKMSEETKPETPVEPTQPVE